MIQRQNIMATLGRCVKLFREGFNWLHVIAKGRVKSSRNEIVFTDHQLDLGRASLAQPGHNAATAGVADGVAGVIMP
jgi:hypothetical protein